MFWNRNRSRLPKSILNWGLIGCGDISQKRVAPALRDLEMCELVAVNRAQYELAEAFAREFGAKKWYRNWQELVEDKDIDAVYIATPVHLHKEQTVAAARAGKHVLVEKPMAMNARECDEMIEACQQHHVKLGVAYYRHFYPILRRVKEILSSGEIGHPVLAQINAFELFDRQPGQPRYWLMRKDQAGGGPMMDFGCHRIEVLMNILGPIEQTVATTHTLRYEREVEDTAIAQFKFSQKAVAVLSVTHAAFEAQDTLDIFCTNGSIHIPVLNADKLILRKADGDRQESHPPHANFHLPLIEDFTLAVLEDRHPVVDGRLGREVQKIEDEIYGESIQQWPTDDMDCAD